MEEIELDGQYMEGIRDGDSSVSLRGKFWHYVCVNFRESHKAELAEGRKYREALEMAESIPDDDLDAFLPHLWSKYFYIGVARKGLHD